MGVVSLEIVANVQRAVSELNTLQRSITNIQRSTESLGGTGQGQGNNSGAGGIAESGSGSPGDQLLKAFKGVKYSQIAQSVFSEVIKGIGMYARFENRSGIFSSALSGNITQAGNQIINRQTESNAFIGGNVAGVAGGIVGGVLGSLVMPGLGTAMGASMGASMAKSLTSALISAEGQKEVGRRETRSTLAGGWLDLYPSLRKMSGLTGDAPLTAFGQMQDGAKYGLTVKETLPLVENYLQMTAGNVAENHRTVKNMDEARADPTLGNTTKTGFASLEVQKALGISYSTGVDRNSLLQYAGTFQRYGRGGGGLGEAAKVAYNGNIAMGGNNITLDEYMRSMQKVFQEGTAKGYARNAESVGRQISVMSNFLSNASGGKNTLYRNSENAAGFVSGVNNALSGSQSASTASQAMMFRTASSLLGKDGNAMDSLLAGEGFDISNMSRVNKTKILTELGSKNPEILGKVVDSLKKTSGGNSTYGVQWLQDAFGWSAGQAQLAWQGKTGDLAKGIETEEYTAGKWRLRDIPISEPNSTEDKFLAFQAESQNRISATGGNFLEAALKDMTDSMARVVEELEKMRELSGSAPVLNENIKKLNLSFEKLIQIEYDKALMRGDTDPYASSH